MKGAHYRELAEKAEASAEEYARDGQHKDAERRLRDAQFYRQLATTWEDKEDAS